MDGQTFISNLQHLGIPEAELLQAIDFDWIFLADSNQFLSLFWKWFFTHVNPEDVLSDEDLSRYAELMSSGSVLSENHLKQIENCAESVSLDKDFPQINFVLEETLEDEVAILEKRLKRLKEKKSLISLEKMKVDANLENKRIYLQHLRHDLEKEKRPVQQVCSSYSRAVEEIATSIQSTVSPFLSFMCSANEGKFVIQISHVNWCENETYFREALFKFIHKQFQEGMKSFTGQSGESQCCLIDSTQLNMQFVRGPREVEYVRNVKDLHRINQMLEETELNSIECKLEKAQKEAEINEAIKFQRTLGSKTFKLSFIKEQISHLEETKKALEQDFAFQKDHLKELGLFISKTEGLRVVSGNYEAKLRRQEYFLSKQEIVYDFLVGQFSRLDLMKIMYDIERQMISSVLYILVSLNKTLREECEGSTKRLSQLNILKNSFLKDGSVGQERESIRALLEDFDTGKYSGKSDRNLVHIVEKMGSSLKNFENKMQLLAEDRMNNMSRLFRSCSILEECLFGTSNSISILPESWVDCKIVDRHAKIEQTMWTLQQEMFQVLKCYEKRKKIIQDTPSLQDDLQKWTKKRV